MRRIWLPRCCLSCGEPLEEYKWPLRVDAFVPCLPCGRLFLVTVDGLEPADLSLEPAWLQQAFDELLASWFDLERRRAGSIQPSLHAAA